MGYLRWAITVAVMVVAAIRGKGPLYRVLVRLNVAWQRALDRLAGEFTLWERARRARAESEVAADANSQYGEAVTVPTALYGHLHLGSVYAEPGDAASVLRTRLAASAARERTELARRMRDRGAR